MKTRNSEVLKDFVAYCKKHPSERFWQALRNWSENGYIIATDDYHGWDHVVADDTFYWEGKNG
jgi:hypothetical protein